MQLSKSTEIYLIDFSSFLNADILRDHKLSHQFEQPKISKRHLKRMDMEKLQLLSLAEELFNPQNAYNKFIECQNYFSTIPVCAVKEVQKHLDKIIALEADLNENSLNDILLIHASNITAIKFFFGCYLPVLTSRVFRFDEKGNDTKIGESLMEDIREFLPKVKDSFENDHILHLKLSYIYCEIRLLNLNLDKNMETIDELFREARIWREKCTKTKECMYFKALLGNLYTHLSFRAGRKQDAEMMAWQIWDDFENDDVKAMKYEPGIALQLAKVCQFQFEKAGVDHNTADVIHFRKKALWYFKKALGNGKMFEAKCTINQQIALKALRQENEGVLGCLMARPHREAIKYMSKSHLGWRKMIRESENNLKHLRYLGHLVYHNYLKYQIKSDLKYFKNMEAIFAELSAEILSSPIIDNLEIIEAMLRMTCRMNSFPRALEVCSNSKKIRDHNKLLFPFSAILKLVEQVSVLKTSPFKIVSNMQLSDTNNVFEEAILQLKNSKHPVCSFWYDFGVNVYFDVLQKSGQSLKYDQLWKFAKKIQHFSMETLVSWQSTNIGTSAATVIEIVEVSISDMAFNFFVFAERNVQPAILSSSNSLMCSIASLFNVPSERFNFFSSEKLLFQELNEENIWSDAEAQLVVFIQISGYLLFCFEFSNRLLAGEFSPRKN